MVISGVDGIDWTKDMVFWLFFSLWFGVILGLGYFLNKGYIKLDMSQVINGWEVICHALGL